MVPPFGELGRLPPGIHFATWEEITSLLGGTPWRDRLVTGLQLALQSLKRAGCSTVYLDGSFATAKPEPGDFDACWDERGVDPALMDPVFFDFHNKRARQKAKFGGELFPSSFAANPKGMSFLKFFQVDKATGDPKGVIALDLRGWLP